MLAATIVIGIFTFLAFVISIANLIYMAARNHRKSVDFFAEIKYIKKNGDRVHDKEKEEVNLYLVNKGCPITIMGIHYDQTEKKKDFKLHIPQLPARLERGQTLKIPKEDFPYPITLEKIEEIKPLKPKPYPRFYAIDSFGKELCVMRSDFRKAPLEQPYLSRPDK